MKKERLYLLIVSAVAFAALAACGLPDLSSSKNEPETEALYVEDMSFDFENDFDIEAFKESAEKLSNSLEENESENTGDETEEEIVPEEEDVSEKEYAYENLEDFFTAPENKMYLDSFSNLPDEYKNVYTDMKVSFSGNRMIYEYYYADYLGDAQAVVETNTESAKGKLFSALRTVIDVKDPMEMQFIYYNNDGSVAADVVAYEDMDSEYKAFENDAEKGTVQYYFESTFGTDYWDINAEQLLESNNGSYSDLTCECVGNELTYTYTYAYNVGDVQAETEAYFTDDVKQRTLDMVKIPSNVKDTVKLSYIYLNPDGSTAAIVEFEG